MCRLFSGIKFHTCHETVQLDVKAGVSRLAFNYYHESFNFFMDGLVASLRVKQC